MGLQNYLMHDEIMFGVLNKQKKYKSAFRKCVFAFATCQVYKKTCF